MQNSAERSDGLELDFYSLHIALQKSFDPNNM